jgi:hypothetical protein
MHSMTKEAWVAVGLAIAVVIAVAISLGVWAKVNGGIVSVTPFIPIVYDTTTGTVAMDVLLSNRRVRAILSTGSPISYFVTECDGCVFPPYDPSLSGAYSNLDVRAKLQFGSQSLDGEMGVDDMVIQRHGSKLPCGYTAKTLTPAPPLVLKSYLLATVNALPEDSPLPPNQIGMSSLRATPQITNLFPGRPYESSMVQAMGPMPQWGLLLRPFGSMLWLTAPPASCGSIKLTYTPLLPALTKATTPFFAAPGRYYAMHITSVHVIQSNNMWSPIINPPTTAVISLETAQVRTFAQSSLQVQLAKTSVTNPQGLAITFANGAMLTIPPGKSMWSQGGTGIQTIYAPLDVTTATALSADRDVMVLGNLAFQFNMLHFDIVNARLGIGMLKTAL